MVALTPVPCTGGVYAVAMWGYSLIVRLPGVTAGGCGLVQKGLDVVRGADPDHVQVQVARAGHPAAGQADRSRAPGQRLAQRVRTACSGGQEPGQERVARADRTPGPVDRRIAHDHAVRVHEYGTVGTEAGQYGTRSPGPQLLRGVDDVAQREQRLADDRG